MENRETGGSFADNWMDARCKEIIFAGDLPNGLNTVGDPETYAICVSRTTWPISGSIKKKLDTGKRIMTCSISMSFYHFKAAKFYGSTYVGHEHTLTPKSVENDTIIPIPNFNELVYFHTKVCDPNCFVVIELVVSLYDHSSDMVEKRYGCGFALISPFFPDLTYAGSTNVYEGSPRELLMLRGGSSIFVQLRKQETRSELFYKVWRCENIGKVLMSSNLIKENQIVGARTRIRGLESTTVNCFDDRGSCELPCIGAQTIGNAVDWLLSPPDSIKLAPNQTLNLLFELTIPQRSEFEQACCSWAPNRHLNEEASLSRRVPGIFGWNCSSPLRRKLTSTSIISRRLRVGIHNGHNIIKWHEVYVLEDGPDVLKSSSPLQVGTFQGCDVLIVAEYLCEATGKSIKSPTQLQHGNIVVTVGLTVISYCALPNHGDSFQIALDLIDDTRCNLFTPNAVFSPPNAATCTLCCNVTMPQRGEGKASKRILESRKGFQTKCDGSSKSKLLERKDAVNEVVNDEDNSCTPFRDSSEEKEECSDDAIVPIPPEQVVERRPNDYQPHTYSVLSEIDDANSSTKVSIILKAFSQPTHGGMRSTVTPKYLSFQLKLHKNDEVTGSFPLKGSTFSEESRLTFEYKISKHLILFMLDRDLFMEVFDDDGIHLGTVAMPMHLLLRQKRVTRSMENLSVDVVLTRGIGYDDQVLRVDEGSVLPGEITGRITLSIELEGKYRPPSSDTFIPCSAQTRYALDLLDTNNELRMLASTIRCTHENNSFFIKGNSNPSSVNAKNIKRRQLDAVKEFLQNYHKGEDKTELLLPLLSYTNRGSLHQDYHMIKAATLIREYEKRKVISAHVNGQTKETVISVRPFVGQSLLVEIEIENRMVIDDWFAIKSSHSGIRIITSATEWESRRRTYGARLLPGKEALVRFESLQDDKVRLKASQTLVVPFVLDQINVEVTQMTLSLVSIRKNCVTDCFLLSVQPWTRVDRRFFRQCLYNERIQFSFKFHPKQKNQRNVLAIKVIKKVPNEVMWGYSSSRDANDEAVYIFTLTCDGMSLAEEIYVVISDDDFNSALECWAMRFEPRKTQKACSRDCD